MKKSSKILMMILLTVIISIFLITSVYAAETSKMLQAWFGVKIMYNNQQIASTTVQPFIVDGTTYVPLRMAVTAFNKDISWDGATSTVTIVDKPSTTEAALRNQIIAKDATIADLQAKLKKAEADSDDSDDSEDLDDLEENLNDDYSDYDDRDYDITLSGDEDDIEVKISCTSSDWSNLSSSERITLLEDICSDIRDEYDDAAIEGYVQSSSGSSKLAYFHFYLDDIVSYNSDKDIFDLETDLNEEYNDYFDDEDLPLIGITLSGDTDDTIEFRIYFDYDEYEDEFDDNISTSERRELMGQIISDIEDEFSDLDSSDIDGYIYDLDGTRLYTY